jgi:hypothetical protein
MTKRDTPRDAEGAKLCAWCGDPIRQSGIGRSKDYCRRSCRQRAYEQRQIDKITQNNVRLIRHMLTEELAASSVSSRDKTRTPDDSSRDETRRDPDSSRDETKPAGPAPAPAQAAVYEEPEPPEERPMPPPLPPRQSRRRGGMTASAMPLFESPEDARGE